MEQGKGKCKPSEMERWIGGLPTPVPHHLQNRMEETLHVGEKLPLK